MWFRTGEELANKLRFLATYREARRQYGEAARQYILSERSAQKVGRAYAEAYRYAMEHRRKDAEPKDISGSLVPVQAA
jgi:glycosyltransferase involved in cell wall biosynthesis